MRARIALVALLLAVGCKRKSSAPPAPATVGSSQPVAAATASASAPAEPAKVAKKADARKEPALPPPPKAEPEEPSKDPNDCGSVVINGERVPLDCHADLEGLFDGGQAIVSRDELNRGGGPLPELVDHRKDGTEGPVRRQGKAGSCTAFALAAAVDHALALHTGHPGHVSALHLWSRYHLPAAQRSIDANLGRLVASEHDSPYDVKRALAWSTAKNCHATEVGGEPIECNQPVDREWLAHADHHPAARITHATRVPHPDAEALKRILARGQDVIIGMPVGTKAFHKLDPEHAVIGELDPRKVKGGHAMLLAGYREQSNGTYFLIHNSWGDKWGDHGYAWIHDKSLRYLKQAAIIDAVPAGAHAGYDAKATRPHGACAKGQLRDAVTQACADECGDRSARVAGQCVSRGLCEEGEVAIGPACVAAAPIEKGLSPEGIAHDCHPGGCTYMVPKGHFGCLDEVCMETCPAPRFVLNQSKSGLYCSE